MNKMCFLKILCYELRRALMNRLFLGLLLMNGLSAWFLLSYDIIRGTAYTAPFSVWSYCTYLGRTLPVAAVTVLLLLSSYYSKKQKQVEILTAAAPFSPFDQVTIRTVTAGICFLLISLVVILLALLFYMRLFWISKLCAVHPAVRPAPAALFYIGKWSGTAPRQPALRPDLCFDDGCPCPLQCHRCL